MGYTHNWKRPSVIQPNLFRAIGNDLRKVLPTLELLGAPVANPSGREEPQIGPEFIGTTTKQELKVQDRQCDKRAAPSDN